MPSTSASVDKVRSVETALARTTSQRKPVKGYKRIKFKSWQPSAETDPPEALYSARSKWRVTQKIKRTPAASITDTSEAEQIERQAFVKSIYTYRCPTPLQHLPVNGHRQDPFVTLPIEATPDVASALDFFLATCVPENKNSEWLVGKPNPHMALLFPFMLENPMLFEIIIALCRGSILMAQGRKVMEDRIFVYRRAHAIKAITDNLTSPDGLGDASLLSITMVLTLEYLMGNIAAVAAHIEGIEQMIKLRGDLDGSTPWKKFVRAGVIAYRSLGCFVTGQPVEIGGKSPGYVKEAFDELALNEAINYPGLPFSPDLCTSLSRLPSGFAELCLSGQISKQMMNFLAYAQATTISCSTMDPIDERVDHEIQVMLSALQRLSFMDTSTIEKHLVCGLLAFAFQLRQARSLNIFHDPPLRHFIDLMQKHEKPDSKRTQDTMIWVSMSIIGALHLRTMIMPGSHEVLDKMFKFYPEASSWSYVRSVLRAHFYTEKIEQHWEKCWHLGMDRWQKVKRQLHHGEAKLIYPSLPPVGANLDREEENSVSFEDMTAHGREAVYTIASMMEAARRCPFQSRFGPSMDNPHLDDDSPMFCPVTGIRTSVM